ncbi:MAG: pro-sigmaK processing inhibitor BofA family protein [Bacteroidales bacterium]|nr:pro-sigmaK processing inhibitor BofA family protein [Bacteroidales bacterium]MCM1415563.1 pro-sigmaK processing inhibitor BofA family protein [bacterium]MCM1424091.1 pro-sigmaK processing inhibitor BofA family protein [bacterium]
MGNIGGVTAILAVCLIVLAIGAMGQKVEWLINFILRAVMGTVGIYAINYILAQRQIQVAVGINPFTVLTSGALGFPGVAVLYGIHFFKIL